MLSLRKSSLSLRQQLEKMFRRNGRKHGTTEMADFDFRLKSDENESLLLSPYGSSRLSYSSNFSDDMKEEKSRRFYIRIEKIFLYYFPFVIIFSFVLV